MVISETPRTNVQLIVDNTRIEKVDKYKYLGTWLTSSNDPTGEIKTRIEIARNHFLKICVQ